MHKGEELHRLILPQQWWLVSQFVGGFGGGGGVTAVGGAAAVGGATGLSSAPVFFF